MSIAFRKRRRVALLVEELEGRVVPSLLGNQLFPADNPWNQRVAAAPVAANSAAIIGNLTSRYGDGRLHPDFGQDYRTGGDLYGIPYNVVHGNTTPRARVVIDAYPGESDLLDAPVPANAVLEGDYQNGPKPGVDNRGDSHLLVYDVDNNVAYEFYRASRPSENADGRWHADQESVWDLRTNTFRTLGWTSADAAGLAILPGLVRPDEALPVSQGGQGVINHAIRFTLQNNIILNKFLYPASHTANPGNTNPAVQPPMGARFRLKAGVDISGLNPQSRAVAQAMKDYGMIVADNGSNFFFSGASYSVDAGGGFALTWDDNDIQDTVRGLKGLHFSDFEVVDLTPAVTGLGATSGAAGTTITVTGRNFSGAAGRLQVLFGTTPAAGVTVLDDGRLTAVVPAGSGTVDVRVQSGVTAPHSGNINNPVFGYGVSAVTAADRFTYVSGGPTAAITAVTPSPRSTAVGTITITFSAAVNGFTLANLQLTTGGSGNLLTGAQTLTTADRVTWTLGNLAGPTDPARRVAAFTLALSPAGVTDLAGRPLAGGASTSFVVFDPALSLQGQTLMFWGTPGNDAYAFTAGAPHLATLNGVTYTIDPAAVTAVHFRGNGGSDSASLTASGGATTATLVPGSGQLQGAGCTASAGGVASLTVYAASASDTAYLYDTPGDDVFGSTASYSYLRGGGVTNLAVGFKSVTAYSTAGGRDAANLYDTAGDDVFGGTASYSYLRGGGVTNLVIGFEDITTYATAGGRDAAYLYDTAGDDVFGATAAYSYLRGGGVTNLAVGFKDVTAYATAGGRDTAYLYDSAGDDVFGATAAYAYLRGGGLTNLAVGFRDVSAYATAGGNDSAYLYDSAGDDVFYGQQASAILSTGGGARGASGFRLVTIVSSLGGFDRAFLSPLFYTLVESGPWH